MLPILEILQLGDQKQPDQGMSCDSIRRRCCPQDLGQEHYGAKRKDHSEQTEYSGKTLCENSYVLTEATQGSVPNARHIFC